MNSKEIVFIDDDHEKFFVDALQKCRWVDEYHKSLCYILGISPTTRNNAHRIYNFKNGNLILECIKEGWQTGSSLKLTRLAFNLYNDGTPTIYCTEDKEEQVSECQNYSVSDIFCCSYAKYIFQAICIRYPSYTNQK